MQYRAGVSVREGRSDASRSRISQDVPVLDREWCSMVEVIVAVLEATV